jgi:hypothetical protein
VQIAKILLLILLLVFGCYLSTACIRYRFDHPHMTETELGMNLWEAITWK